MTLEELKNKIQDLGTEIRDDARALAKASAGREVSMDDVRKMQSAMKDKQERLTALQDAFTVQSDEESKKVPKADPAQANALTEMRKSNEYARSFALGIRKGIRPGGAYDENCKVLYDALTIGGGDPAGEDGGFLVPEDIDHQIKELVRTLNPLEEFFSTENVTGTSGWRVQDAAPTTGMAAIDEMGAVLEGEAPTFTKVPYTVSKYGMFLPVSKELASDEIANLFGYLSRWFARKETITKNTLLLAALGTLSTTLITAGEELKDIKSALNKALDPMISVNATIVTNQTGFDILDNLVDGTGRPLLDTDPKTGMPMMLKTRPIRVIADSVLANMSGKAPFYIGDFRQYATMFQRTALEIVSTDIGGSAFRSDSIEVRGIKRMGVSKFDTAAAVLRTMTPV